VEQNIKINKKREIKKLFQEEKNQAILLNKFRDFQLNWSKQKSELKNDYQIIQQKWSNWMKKQTSNLKEVTVKFS
jgi:hypothetical protein